VVEVEELKEVYKLVMVVVVVLMVLLDQEQVEVQQELQDQLMGNKHQMVVEILLLEEVAEVALLVAERAELLEEIFKVLEVEQEELLLQVQVQELMLLMVV
jgi:hypothetical protein